MKQCSACKEFKLLSEYNRCTRMKDGLHIYCRLCVNEHKKNYREKYRESLNHKTLEYKKKNKSKFVSAKAKRRASKQNATPSWADHSIIDYIYKERDYLMRRDGIIYQVDHIIPLTHALVCGLHVHNNLQILTAKENMSKGNRFIPGNCI